MASSAWRSKLSKWLIRSLLKKGRVMDRWNFQNSPKKVLAYVEESTIETDHLLQTRQFLAKDRKGA